MWIKICANTNLDDAALAVELGADALGFVFAPSPRRVTPEQVAVITSRLPEHVEKIGVFYTLDAEEIVAAVRTAGLTGVQLHGGFSQRLVDSLTAQLAGKRLIQTAHWKTTGQTADAFSGQVADLNAAAGIDVVLVDSRTAAASGGTGVAFDWVEARNSLSVLSKPLVIAGGLTPANVRLAIATLQPWGVDVASGVEVKPGRKDPEKLAAFLKSARESAAE